MLERYVRSGQRLLRCGYTTGTCAAIAAAGAARLLLKGERAASVRVRTPGGVDVEADLEDLSVIGDAASCTVVKDAGDDPDVTDGCHVRVTVRKTPGTGTAIDGGPGVGRVTLPGLDQPVGAAAVNSGPRRQIREAVDAERAGYAGGLSVEISVPEGERLAERTFNPHLGIVGGISILGTTGIVEPMSERALIDAVGVEIRQARALGADRLILTPGNYARSFLDGIGFRPSADLPCVTCSNFIGDALDMAASEGFGSVLLVGHIGKLVKLAGGIMDTHSHRADCRMELFCAHAAICGAGTDLCRALMASATTDACVDLLDGAGLREAVLGSLTAAVGRHLAWRSGPMRTGAVLFSNAHGVLGVTDTARELMEAWSLTLDGAGRRGPA